MERQRERGVPKFQKRENVGKVSGTLAGRLSPPEAVEAAAFLRELLAEASANAQPIRLGLSDETAAPLTLQLLVAARRSCEVLSVPLEFDDAAATALNGLDQPFILGEAR